MARPEAKNVDYFPCYCVDGKVLFILESRWGNNGYAFFYKLWKRLGNADFHFIDLRPVDNWEYFRAKMGVSDAETTDILNKLAEMGVIDPDLWAERIIWSDSFVDSVKEVWIKRKQLIPQKPMFLIQKPQFQENQSPETLVSAAEVHKVNKSKVNKRKDIGTRAFVKPTLEQVKEYCKERGNGVDPQKWLDHYTSNGWKVGKNQMQDWKAAVRTWERNNFDGVQSAPKTYHGDGRINCPKCKELVFPDDLMGEGCRECMI